MSNMDISFTGFDDLAGLLKDATDLSDVQAIVRKHGAALHLKAQIYAPHKSGNLKRSSTTMSLDNGLSIKVTYGADYAPYQEYGTRFMPGKFYLKRAFDQESKAFIGDLERLFK